MAIDNSLVDMVTRFTGADVDEFRRQWNSQIKENAETPEKQSIFEKVQKQLKPKNLIAGGISAEVRIKYTSLSGELKERDVIIRRVFKSNQEVLIDALCVDINAPRIIKMKNIIQLIDVATKKAYDNADVFFETILGIDVYKKQEENIQNQTHLSQVSPVSSLKNGEFKTALDLTRHEITVLLFIAGIDGNKDIKELGKLIEYVHKRCPNLNFDDAQLLHYLQINHPDTQSFYFSLERILGKEGWIVKMFLEKLLELILADGKVEEKEKLFLADFLRILEEDGFILNFKVN